MRGNYVNSLNAQVTVREGSSLETYLIDAPTRWQAVQSAYGVSGAVLVRNVREIGAELWAVDIDIVEPGNGRNAVEANNA